jgi:NADPH2:quinone reductase
LRTHAIRIHEYGGPEVLHWEAVDLPAPGPGQALLRQHAVGVNFIDIYHRSGLYKLPLPSAIGVEAAGVVEAVGPGVTEVQPGDRVAYDRPPGAYAEARVVPADRLVKLPDAISFEQAAAMMLKGLTAQMLVRRVHRVVAGETVLLHAAAGGVGLIMVQWLHALGATVIGTVGSEAKAELARAHGCHHVLVLGRDDIVARVRELTGGAGVPVVYDSIGRETFALSLDCVRRTGLMVSYGNASGPVEPVAPALLAARGSLFLTRPTRGDYALERGDLLAMAAELFEMVAAGRLKIEVRQRYALRDAAQAHADLAARRTTGSTVLLP